MSSPFERDEFLAGFLAEADEILARANSALVALDEAARSRTSAPRPLRDLFRSMHTLKGLSSMVGVEPIVELAHETETLLRSAERSGGALPQKTVQLLLRAVRGLEERLVALRGGKPVPAAPAALLSALAGTSPVAPAFRPLQVLLPPELGGKISASEEEELASAVSAGSRALQVRFVPSPENASKGITITSVRDRLAKLSQIVKVVPLSIPAGPNAPGGLAFCLLITSKEDNASLSRATELPEQSFVALEVTENAPPAEEEGEGETDESATGGSHVRVEVARLDDAVEQLAGLVVLRFKLGRATDKLAAQGADVRELRQVLGEHARTVRDLRAAIMRTRLVSVAELLARAPLIARGVADSAGKSVRVQLDVGNAELDKAVAERIFPAIVHLLRNAVDHGIERPEVRTQLGKPAEGTLTVSCLDLGGNMLELTLQDDGSGIDRERVARRAGKPAPANDEELLELLATPGFSTREEATRTSGRGMGMDIVQRIAVNELGGELALSSELGKGTTFRLRIPLSITILDVLSFRCGGQTFVVPTGSVEDVVEVSPSAVVAAPKVPGAAGRTRVRLLQRGGAALPLYSLTELLQLDPEQTPVKHAILVQKNNERLAFEVDRMVGRQEVVVRPLVDPLVQASGVSGSTDLGDGVPTLVLDLAAFASSGAGALPS